MRVEMFQTRLDRKCFRRNDIAGFRIQARINVEPRGVLEKMAQPAEQAAFALVIKAFIEYFSQFGCPERQAKRTICIAR